METEARINPFVVGRYVAPQYFCGRDKETDFLMRQIVNGRNTAVISPRRMGKTGLILHTFRQPEICDRYHTFFVDIYATSNLAEFVYLLGKAIFDELKPRHRAWTDRFFQIVSSLRVGFRLDAFSGEPIFDMGLGDIRSPATTLDEIFSYLESAERPCVVAIDEFQQIGTYPEKNVEALLRTRIQRCERTGFIFSGSKRHLMNNIFNSSSKPFYQSTIITGLEPIPEETYVAFACRLFEENRRVVEPELVRTVYRRFEGCTWFVQMMMNELYALTPEGRECGIGMFGQAWENVIQTQENSYKDTLFNLPARQKRLLQAISKDGTVASPMSADFIRKHNLDSASSVQAALAPLLKNDIVTHTDDGYRVYDYFFAEWLRKYF